MHDIVGMFLLVRLEYLADIFIYIIRSLNLAMNDEPHPTLDCLATHRRSKVDDCLARDMCLLMIISDFYVHDVHWLVEITAARE